MTMRFGVMAMLLFSPAAVLAQTDEIQVYDANIAEPSVFNLMVHMNFTPIGRKTPIFQAPCTDYRGGFGNPEFVPATRVAYNFNDRWAAAAEEYSDFGPLRQFETIHEQFHEVWAVMDHTCKIINIEAGVGVGVTAGADRLTFKLMLSRDLNSRHKEPAATPHAMLAGR